MDTASLGVSSLISLLFWIALLSLDGTEGRFTGQQSHCIEYSLAKIIYSMHVIVRFHKEMGIILSYARNFKKAIGFSAGLYDFRIKKPIV